MNKLKSDWLLYAAAAVIALIAVLLISVYIQKQIAAGLKERPVQTIEVEKTIPMLTVLTVTKNLVRGTILKKDDLAVVEVPESLLKGKGFIKQPDAVIGQYLKQDVYAGEWLIAQKISKEFNEKAEKTRVAFVELPKFNALVDQGARAVKVTLKSTDGLNGLINPGDFIDVIATFPDTQKGRQYSKTILQNIRVLAVGAQNRTQSLNGVQDEQRSKILAVENSQGNSILTLQVTPAQSEKLALAMSIGQIMMTLRSDSDADVVPSKGVFAKNLETKEMKEAAPQVSKRVVKRSNKDVVQLLLGDEMQEVKIP